jgi:hypothetical protein
MEQKKQLSLGGEFGGDKTLRTRYATRQMSMFGIEEETALRRFAQATTEFNAPLTLKIFDARTDEEREQQERRDAEALTYPLFQVVTFGYQGADAAAIIDAVQKLDMVLVDIRLSARSRAQAWSGARLHTVLQERYVHVPALGNMNYRSSNAEIVLKDADAGVEIVKRLLAEGKKPLLMCVCPDVRWCHRKIVGDTLVNALGVTVTHHSPATLLALAAKNVSK